MMKLLMITQKIDADDDILGAYHEWVRHIAKSFDRLSVICLYQGNTSLPEAIRIFSLGKEKSNFFPLGGFFAGRQFSPRFKILKKLKYTWRFYRYIFRLYKDYDAVFVHMNPVYVILGFISWKIMGKKIFMWYAHPEKNILVRIAYGLSYKVVTSVPEAFYAKSPKVVAVGQGIDTRLFSSAPAEGGGRSGILSLGRIYPAKRIEILLQAAKILTVQGVMVFLNIVGNPSESCEGKKYYQKLHQFVKNNDLSRTVSFSSSVPNHKAQELYNKYSIFVNLSPTGYFDKTVLEAMACECVVLASNKAYKNIFPQDLREFLIFQQDDAMDLSQKIRRVMNLTNNEHERIGKRLRAIVEQNHSIYTLGERLKYAFLS